MGEQRFFVSNARGRVHRYLSTDRKWHLLGKVKVFSNKCSRGSVLAPNKACMDSSRK